MLKREKLSEEAEAKRQKYEILLASLEQGQLTGARPHSIVCDEDSGYFSANRGRGKNPLACTLFMTCLSLLICIHYHELHLL